MFIEQLMNAGILTYVLAVAALIVSIILLAAGARGQIKMAVAGISIPIIILGAILLCSGGEIKVWLTEQVHNALSSGTAVAAPATTAPARAANAAAPPSSHPSSGHSTSSHPTAAPSPTPPSGNATVNTNTTPSNQSEIFDLGSKVDGHFPDGVAYQLYTIVSGDTVYNIRHRFGLTEAEICSRNNIDIRRHIVIGRQLKIPLPPT